MKRLAGVVALTLLLAAGDSTWAEDATTPVNVNYFFECQRFESKCKGKACYELAENLIKDTQRQILSMKQTERVRLRVNKTSAIETLSATGKESESSAQLTINYDQVNFSPGLITVEKPAKDDKTPKTKLLLDINTGFYASYGLHTDGSIKDIPLGEPYLSYFGWCTMSSRVQ